ncbi:TlpA family protein disulfide reductase [Niabella soli]|uniref:Alkyl hydroperoxide reductase n=1 Tax=Niabella soli DSM 19437 TaxID=929713 RepID=W0EYK2_9BACT|nr:TlpA disulfide reductase family protein [Niabella soli]AHF15847.1 alkyl hydroperoxide reductase [Niabella soli DSM 19437]
MTTRIISGALLSALLTIAACKSGADKKTAEAAGTVAAPVQNDTVHQPAADSSHTAGLPHFKMMDEQGRAVALDSLKGKKVFVNIWASWCPPCRAEMPSIQKLSKKTDKNKVTFVLLSVDDDPAAGIGFKKAQQIELPVFFPGEQLPSLFNVEGIPATFIFDEKGALIKSMVGMENYDTQEYVDLLEH